MIMLQSDHVILTIVIMHRPTRYYALVIDAIADVTIEGHVPLSSSLIGRPWRARPPQIPPAVQRDASGKDLVARLHRRYRHLPSHPGRPG